MRHLLYILTTLAALVMLGACRDEDPATPADYDRLEVAASLTPYTTPDYEHWDNVTSQGHKTFVLNSLRDVTEAFGPGVAAESPEYLEVDFDRYTLLVQYHVLTQQIEGRRYYFYHRRQPDSYTYELCVGYVHGDNFTMGQIMVDRIAVLVDKLPDAARVQWAETIIEPD